MRCQSTGRHIASASRHLPSPTQRPRVNTVSLHWGQHCLFALSRPMPITACRCRSPFKKFCKARQAKSPKKTVGAPWDESTQASQCPRCDRQQHRQCLRLPHCMPCTPPSPPGVNKRDRGTPYPRPYLPHASHAPLRINAHVSTLRATCLRWPVQVACVTNE